MITFERSRNYDIVRRIMTHPQIWPHISDDGSPPVRDYRPPEGEHIWYVLAWDDGEELLGLWMLHPENSVTWQIHTCLLPSAWGDPAIAAARALPEWIWQHTVCRRIITNVPSSNRLALRFAIRAGMVVYGINRGSYLKDGILQDQVCLGLSCPYEMPRAEPQDALGAIAEARAGEAAQDGLEVSNSAKGGRGQ